MPRAAPRLTGLKGRALFAPTEAAQGIFIHGGRFVQEEETGRRRGRLMANWKKGTPLCACKVGPGPFERLSSLGAECSRDWREGWRIWSLPCAAPR